MYAIVKILAGVAIGGALTVLAFNPTGFFKSYEDEPAWVDVATEVAAAGAVAAVPGADVYSQRCAVCHGANGKGVAGAFPPLDGSAIVNGDPEKIVKIILHGFAGRIVRNGNEYNGVMTAHQDLLNDEQVALVTSYIRSSWSNSAESIDVDFAQSIRAANAGRAGAWTEAEL